MKNFLAVIERIKKKLNCSSEAEVAKLLGMTKTALANHKSRGSIPYDALFTFCESEKISLDWLFNGESSTATIIEECTGIDPNYTVVQNSTALITYLRRGSLKKPILEAFRIRRDWIESELHADPEGLELIPVTDDTMEPTLKRGDNVIVDKNLDSGEITESIPDGLYMLDEGERYSIRRLQILPNAVVSIECDNKAYKSYEAKIYDISEKIIIFGRVVWVGKILI